MAELSALAATAAVAPGFWQSSQAVGVVAGVVALLVGLAVLLLIPRASYQTVRTRVGSFIPTDGTAVGAEGHAERARGLRAAAAGSSWWKSFAEAVAVSRSTRSPGFLMKRAGVVAVVLAPLCALLSHQPLVGLVPLLAFPFAERWWVMRAAQKQRSAFAETLPGYMQDMGSAIRIGRSFVSAMAVIADSAEEPTRSEFERAVTDESLGRPLDEALAAIGERMQSADVDQLALIAELNRRSGSNVAEALDRVAEGARERAELRREVSALTAQSKMSSSVLTGLPVVMVLGLSLIAPTYVHPLFHTTFGIVALVVAAMLVFTGWKVMKKIAFVEV